MPPGLPRCRPMRSRRRRRTATSDRRCPSRGAVPQGRRAGRSPHTAPRRGPVPQARTSCRRLGVPHVSPRRTPRTRRTPAAAPDRVGDPPSCRPRAPHPRGPRPRASSHRAAARRWTTANGLSRTTRGTAAGPRAPVRGSRSRRAPGSGRRPHGRRPGARSVPSPRTARAQASGRRSAMLASVRRSRGRRRRPSRGFRYRFVPTGHHRTDTPHSRSNTIVVAVAAARSITSSPSTFDTTPLS